jgi:hypothetical protein
MWTLDKLTVECDTSEDVGSASRGVSCIHASAYACKSEDGNEWPNQAEFPHTIKSIIFSFAPALAGV